MANQPLTTELDIRRMALSITTGAALGDSHVGLFEKLRALTKLQKRYVGSTCVRRCVDDAVLAVSIRLVRDWDDSEGAATG